MLLSIAYFAWGRVIIYDDNLSYRSLSQAKRKIYIFLLRLYETKTVATCCDATCCERFKTCFLIEVHPGQFALPLHDAFWDPRFTGMSLRDQQDTTVPSPLLRPAATTSQHKAPMFRVLRPRFATSSNKPPGSS